MGSTVGGVDIEELMSKVEQTMRAAAGAAKAKPAQASGGPQGGGGEEGGGGKAAGGADAATGCQANQAANQKWQGFSPPAAKTDPGMPSTPATPSSSPSATPSTTPAPTEPATPAAASTTTPSSAPATPQATSTPAKPTSAPSELDKTLAKNPNIKTNQDLVNKFYKDGGNTWEGASKQAKANGTTMSDLIRDRGGDVKKTADAVRTKTPTSATPTPTPTPTATPTPSTSPTAPVGPNDKIPGGINRSQFDKELKNPAVRERMKALAVAEVGSNPQAQRALMETIFNRAQATGKSLSQTMDPRYYEPMQHGGAAMRRAEQSVKNNPALNAGLDAALRDVQRGSNVSNYATDNASAGVARSAERSQVITARIGGETFSRKEGLRNGVHHPDYRPWLRNIPRNPTTPQQQPSV